MERVWKHINKLKSINKLEKTTGLAHETLKTLAQDIRIISSRNSQSSCSSRQPDHHQLTKLSKLMLLKTAGSSPAQEISRARAPSHEIFNRIRKLEDSRIGSLNCQSSCSKTTGPIISSRTSSSSCSRQPDRQQLKKILKGSRA
jgi:hypothetical protein